jgi:hypothetical protein
MRSFFFLHIILKVNKQQDLRNQIYQTAGDVTVKEILLPVSAAGTQGGQRQRVR